MALRFKVTLAGEDLGIFDPDEVMIEHAMLLEDKTGMSISDLVTGIGRVSARPLQALVWFQRIRNGQPDALLHANFKLGDLNAEDVAEEMPDPTGAADGEAAPMKESGNSDGSTSDS